MDRGAVAESFAQHRQLLWGMCYRMTGSAADADDLVQDTFVRALEQPPAGTGESWRPWLVTVAMNLARDALRRRRRRAYRGPWLPSPIETEFENAVPSFEIPRGEDNSTEGRYELMESLSFAFLVALEALTPQQRAVLLLREVFDFSAADTASVLGLSEANIKTSLYRARRAMSEYDRSRNPPSASLAERTRAVLSKFVNALAAGDVDGCRDLLAADVIGLSDGGEEFMAAKVPLCGRERVLKFQFGLMRVGGGDVTGMEMREINGLPALVVDFSPKRPGRAPRSVVRCDLDESGRIAALYAILATDKLSAVH